MARSRSVCQASVSTGSDFSETIASISIVRALKTSARFLSLKWVIPQFSKRIQSQWRSKANGPRKLVTKPRRSCWLWQRSWRVSLLSECGMAARACVTTCRFENLVAPCRRILFYGMWVSRTISILAWTSVQLSWHALKFCVTVKRWFDCYMPNYMPNEEPNHLPNRLSREMLSAFLAVPSQNGLKQLSLVPLAVR